MPFFSGASTSRSTCLLVVLLSVVVSSALAFQSSCSNRPQQKRAFQRLPALFGESGFVSEFSAVDGNDNAESIEEDDLLTDSHADDLVPVSMSNEENDDDQVPVAKVDNDSYVFIPKAVEESPKATETAARSKTDSPRVPTQYAALAPGTVVHIQVGDISLARKAWKKRRRSGSPLLVPCSVLNVDRQSTVLWNLIYLLEKFGTATVNGIRITSSELTKRHRTHLKSSLAKHATAMGYETVNELVEGLLNKKAQDSYGVKLVYTENGDDTVLSLEAPLSRFRAQKRANKAAILQFADKVKHHEDTLEHTGIVRNRRQETGEDGNLYQLQPLSAALRVNQEDVDAGLIQNGSMHAAVVFTYDAQGDAGDPMLTLSLNPGRNQVRDRLKISPDQTKYHPILNPKFMLKELKVGDGPMEGKVIRLIKGGALLDCGVGRKVSSNPAPDAVRVLGFLRFQDAIASAGSKQVQQADLRDLNDIEDDIDDEEWDSILSIDDLDFDQTLDKEEKLKTEDDGENFLTDTEDFTISDMIAEEDDTYTDSEDITHHFKMDESGSLTYTDPETGETKIVSSADDVDEELEEEDESDEAVIFVDHKPPRAFAAISRPAFKPSTRLKPKRLSVGDRIEVFIKSVSKQSSQLMVTMDPSVQGTKAKELKKEGNVSKKMSRLTKQLGGAHRMGQLQGKECDGVVKATSNTGDWFYVQPNLDNLPVGIASVPADLEASIGKGDTVRIQLEGVDENRGQLSMRILKKLSP